MRRLNLATGLLLCGLCLGTLTAQAANIQGPKRSVLDKLKDEDAVRNRMLYRKGRISVAPALSMTLNDAYRRNVLIGFDGIYNISDEIGVGLSGFFGLAYNTSLADQLETKRKETVEEGAFADIGYLVTSEIVYTPVFGKAAFAGEISVAYDMHLIAGAGLMGLSGGGDLNSAAPVGTIGAGLRVFLDQAMAISVQVRDYIVYRANNEVPDVYADQGDGGVSSEKKVMNQFALTVSYAFFFPQSPARSN
ncbi:MAG: outer membrane beta-barrel domain-containing protein [Bradymonadia bacterium]